LASLIHIFHVRELLLIVVKLSGRVRIVCNVER